MQLHKPVLSLAVCVRSEIAWGAEEAFQGQNLCPKGIYTPRRQVRQGYKQLCEWTLEKQRESVLVSRGVCVCARVCMCACVCACVCGGGAGGSLRVSKSF